MLPETLAIIGVGNVRFTPRVLATLAGFYGERPMRVVLYDPDSERLDLFCRLARCFFRFAKSSHDLAFTEDSDEALADAERVIVQLEENGARKLLSQAKGKRSVSLVKALERALANLSPTAETLSLLESSVRLPIGRYRTLSWIGQLTEAERVAVPHQALRWIHGEEYPHELMAECESNGLRHWLEDPSSAALVLHTR